MAVSKPNPRDPDLTLLMRKAQEAIQHSKELMELTEELLQESRESLRHKSSGVWKH